jgi:dynactin complex subunit
MSQEELDREMVELRIQLSYIGKLLQRNIEENQRQGWNLKKKVKWHVMQLFARKLRRSLRSLKHRLSALLKKEKLRGAEFRKRSLTEEGVHFCEPEQGYPCERMRKKRELLRVS